MNDTISRPTTELLAAAQGGDARAFEQLFADQLPKLRGLLYRMVGHADDVDDLAQQALLKAHEGLRSFRGDAAPGTWLCAIGARLAVDHLRARKRWRERAQIIFAASCLTPEGPGAEVGAAMASPDFQYDVNEHIAYCFTCVGRSLTPEAQAALVLRDVLGLSNEEAADAIGVSRSVLRHRLAEARETMQTRFEGLCALVSKRGACWQCAGLREAAPEGRRGPRVPERVDWPRRLAIVRDAALGTGPSRAMHATFFRHTQAQEEAEAGDPEAETDCGRPSSEGD